MSNAQQRISFTGLLTVALLLCLLFLLPRGWRIFDPAPTLTFTGTATSSITPTPSQTLTPTPTSTATITPTPTPSNTATNTHTFTPTATFTASNTATFTSTPLPTFTPTITPTVTPLPTATPTATATPIPVFQTTLNIGVGYRYERDTKSIFTSIVGQYADVTGTVQVVYMADFINNRFGILACNYDPNALSVDYHDQFATGIIYRDKEGFITAARQGFKQWIPHYALQQWAEARANLQQQADQSGVPVTIPEQPDLITCP